MIDYPIKHLEINANGVMEMAEALLGRKIGRRTVATWAQHASKDKKMDWEPITAERGSIFYNAIKVKSYIMGRQFRGIKKQSIQ